MRLFVRVEGLSPFSLILQDNLLAEHYEEIAVKYFRENWHTTRQAPELMLIRRIIFKNNDQLLDFKRKKRNIKAPSLTPSKPADPSQRVYATTGQAEMIRQEMVVTNPPVPSLGVHSETELLIKSISLNRLVMKMTDPTVSPFLENVFWVTYRSFSSSGEVLEKIIERYDVPPLARIGEHERSPTDAAYYNELRLRVRMRIFQLLENWVERFYFDFAEDNVHRRLSQFVHEKIDADGMPSKVLVLMKICDRTALANRKPVILPGIVSRSLATSAVLAQYPPREIANQLTLLTLFVHNQLFPSELLGRQWDGPSAVNVPNFILYRDVINKVSNWVSYTIVSEKDQKVRTHNMAGLLDLCDELHKMNNWDMLVAVYGGISDPSVARLTTTAAMLPEHAMQLLPKFEELLSLKGTSKVLKSAMASSQRPRFPSIVVHLRDLLYLEETPAKTESGMINFLRCIHQYNLVSFLLDGQHQKLEYVPNLELMGVFSKWKIVDDRALANLSQDAQAR